MVEFCVVLTNITKSHDILTCTRLALRLYLYEHVYLNCSVRHIGQTLCSFEHYLVLQEFCSFVIGE